MLIQGRVIFYYLLRCDYIVKKLNFVFRANKFTQKTIGQTRKILWYVNCICRHLKIYGYVLKWWILIMYATTVPKSFWVRLNNITLFNWSLLFVIIITKMVKYKFSSKIVQNTKIIIIRQKIRSKIIVICNRRSIWTVAL